MPVAPLNDALDLRIAQLALDLSDPEHPAERIGLLGQL